MPGQPRVMMYSHDSWGLGHLRRNLAIAGAITGSSPLANVLIVSGSPCATQFPLPPRVDIVKLPAVTKDDSGAYAPRCLSGSLGALIELRAGLLLAALRSFHPDILIIDHHVIGVGGEILPTLRAAKADGVHCVLGLRDIIDEPERVDRDLSSDDCQRALCEAYDEILVYGAAKVFDPRAAYESLRSVRDRIKFTGYVVPAAQGTLPSPVPTLRPQILVTCGGGEDGRERVECFLDAASTRQADWEIVIVSGPLMPPQWSKTLRRSTRGRTNVTVHKFSQNLPQLIRSSDAIVSMAGYNASAELLASRRPGILLPRTSPRREQLIRAERFAGLHLAQCVTELDPQLITEAVLEALDRPALGIPPPLNGLASICESLPGLLPQSLATETQDLVVGSEVGLIAAVGT